MSGVPVPDLPRGWQWASGTRTGETYTRWFQTEYRLGGHLAGVHGLGGYDGQVYHDPGGDHHVEIIPIVDATGDDPTYGYPVVSRADATEQAALDAVPEVIRTLGD